MKNLKLGEIVLMKFPFTDGKTFKRRPALVLKDTDDGGIIVCRITSKTYNSRFDIGFKNWKRAGLK
ncbi:MAG: type II toxin-antitoxin system PemK/MazF family toxin, partial [Chryseobacterium sp.]